MLKTNLSTRPFYNERAVSWGLALAFVAIVALTIFNVTRVLSLSARQGTLSAEVARQEARVLELTSQAARVRGSIDQKALARVIAAAHEANAIIDQRTFSWTELFNHLESTLPTGVMLTSVVPKVETEKDGRKTTAKDKFVVTLSVLGREVEQIDAFIEKLEETGAFTDVLTSDEAVNDNDEIEARLVARYHPAARAGSGAAEGAPAGAPSTDAAKPDAEKPAAPKDAAPKAAAQADGVRKPGGAS